jgi:hypothetical protein
MIGDEYDPVYENAWEYVDRDTEYDKMAWIYDDLCDVMDTCARRLRRDPQVAAARERLRVAINALWQHDDGYSDYGYEGPNVGEWDELYPVAQDCLVDVYVALAAIYALRDLLRELLRAEGIRSLRPPWLPSPEPTVRPPSRHARSEPDLALAPPLPCVAPFSDDVMAAAA